MKRLVLFVADIVILYAALIIVLALRYPGEFALQLQLHAVPFSTLFIIWIGVFYMHNLYDPQTLRNTNTFYSTLSRAIILATALSIAYFYLIPVSGITPRTNLFLFLIVFIILQIVNRAFFNSVIERRFQKNTAIVGLNQNSLELARYLKQNPQLGYELRAVLDIAPETLRSNAHELEEFGIIQGLENIDQLIRSRKVSVVVVSPEAYQVQEIIDLFYKSLGHNVTFYNLASFYEKVTGRVPLGAINQIWFLENITESGKRFYELAKRVFDTVAASVLSIVFIVLLPIISLAIKLDSSGSVFYRQRRVGRLGKTFEMIKFRTMHEHAERESGAVWAQHNDPRITRIGNFLRKTRLDELPQVWNILKGDMSFIGPRAERPEFHQKLTQEIPFYEERYLVKPGATGWAQLQRSYYASVVETHEKLQYDLYYIKNRSLMLDLGILLRTANVVLRGGGR